MKSVVIVSILLAQCPFFISGSSPIRVALKSQAMSAGTMLKSTSSITIGNISTTAFYGQMTLGTPPQAFNFAFDTSSNALWIPGIACDSCGDLVKFNQTASTTFQAGNGATLTNTFDYYGTVLYTMNSDTVGVSGLNASNQDFGLVTSMGSVVQGVDGFAGLGPGQQSFVSNILSQNNLSSVFSLYIDTTTGAETGEIILGGTTSDTYYSSAENILTVKSLSVDGQWQLGIQNISIGATPIQCTSCVAVISILGNPSITGPPAIIQFIYQAINANASGFVNTSNALPDVAFAIGGYYFNLTKDDYLSTCNEEMCQTKFIAGSTNENQFTLGTMFVTKYFWIFNTTSYEIGIAPLGGGSSSLQSGFFVLTSMAWAWIYLNRNLFA